MHSESRPSYWHVFIIKENEEKDYIFFVFDTEQGAKENKDF
jgi:hypothetical protein